MYNHCCFDDFWKQGIKKYKIKFIDNHKSLLKNPRVEGAAIATPATTCYSMEN